MEEINGEAAVVTVEAHPIQQIESAAVVQQLDAAHRYPMHTTAKQCEMIIARCAQVCTADYETAEECHYSLPRAGKSIEGPSIHMMRVLKCAYGNIAVATRILGADDKNIKVQAVAWDMETNVRQSAEVTRPIIYGPRHNKAGQRFDEDMIKTTAMAAQSIAERNALQAVIPKALWGPVYRAVKQRLTEGAGLKDDLGAIRKKMLAWYQSRGVAESVMCAKVNKRRVADLDREDLIALGGLKTRIDQMDTSLEEEFPELEQEPEAKPAQEAPAPRKRPEPQQKASAPKPQAETASNKDPSLGDPEWETAYSEMMDLWRSCGPEQKEAILTTAGVKRVTANMKLETINTVITAIHAVVMSD